VLTDVGEPEPVAGIGILRERALHAGLKRWYARPGDRIEVPVDGFIVDLVREDLLVEVQTRGFATLKAKLLALLGRGHRVRVVHPIAANRWILNVDAGGAVLSRRRSPRHGIPADLAAELVSFPELLADPGFELEILLTVEEELRSLAPGRCWRRGGWTTVERRLVDVTERVILAGPDDLARLMPAGLPERFTTADLASGLRRPPRLAQQLAYCLRRARVVEAVGRRAQFVEYEIRAGSRS
jgi:hypothetical protein